MGGSFHEAASMRHTTTSALTGSGSTGKLGAWTQHTASHVTASVFQSPPCPCMLACLLVCTRGMHGARMARRSGGEVHTLCR